MPVSMEELLEQQWDQSARFLMEQSQHFDGGWVYVRAGRHVCVCVCVRERERVCVCVTHLNKADSDPGSSWSKASTLMVGGYMYGQAGMCMCVWVCVRVCACTCVFVGMYVCVRQREFLCVCVWVRERVCVCVCVLPV